MQLVTTVVTVIHLEVSQGGGGGEERSERGRVVPWKKKLVKRCNSKVNLRETVARYWTVCNEVCHILPLNIILKVVYRYRQTNLKQASVFKKKKNLEKAALARLPLTLITLRTKVWNSQKLPTPCKKNLKSEKGKIFRCFPSCT